MKHLFRTFLVAVLSMATSEVFAYQAKIDGIYYNFDKSRKTAEVTYQEYRESENLFRSDYSGNVIIPESVTYNGEPYSVTSIGEGAFYCCSGLTSVTIPNSIYMIGSDAFAYCSSLTSITIPNSVKDLGVNTFYGCSSLTSVEIGNSVKYLAGTFYGCSSLTSIEIPNNVTSIGSYAFYGCSSLTSITIPNGVTWIGDYEFYGCSSLTSITIPNSVTAIGAHAFYWCYRLTSITIPNGVTSIDNYAFYGCSGLTSVTIPKGVTWIGRGAFMQGGVRCFVIADGDGYIQINENILSGSPTETLYIGRDYFSSYLYTSKMHKMGISTLTNVTIGKNIKKIPQSAFEGYSQLTEIKGGNGVTAIGQRAFYGCEKLKSFYIPDGVKKIENCTFKDCKRLSDLRIGSGVEEIGDSVFYNCPLTRIYNYAEYPQTCGKGVFSIVKPYCKLFVKEDSQDYYRVFPEWSSFNIQPMDAEALPVSPVFELQGNGEPYYDLNGRKVGKAKNGIYIHNGRKTVVK